MVCIFLAILPPSRRFAASCDASVSKRPSDDAVLQQLGIEVDEESQALASQAQVGDELCLKYGQHVSNALHLYDDKVFDDEIDSVVTERSTLVVREGVRNFVCGHTMRSEYAPSTTQDLDA